MPNDVTLARFVRRPLEFEDQVLFSARKKVSSYERRAVKWRRDQCEGPSFELPKIFWTEFGQIPPKQPDTVVYASQCDVVSVAIL